MTTADRTHRRSTTSRRTRRPSDRRVSDGVVAAYLHGLARHDGRPRRPSEARPATTDALAEDRVAVL